MVDSEGGEDAYRVEDKMMTMMLMLSLLCLISLLTYTLMLTC